MSLGKWVTPRVITAPRSFIMPRRTARPQPDRTLDLATETRDCPGCGRKLRQPTSPKGRLSRWMGSSGCDSRSAVAVTLNARVITSVSDPSRKAAWFSRSTSSVSTSSPWWARSVMPEHRSIPEIHAELVRRQVPICARSVGNLLDRYDELLALSCSDVASTRSRPRPGR